MWRADFYGAQGGFDFNREVTSLCEDPPLCTSSSSRNSRANSFASFLLGLPDQASPPLQVPEVYSACG